jgi:hypothetical protein
MPMMQQFQMQQLQLMSQMNNPMLNPMFMNNQNPQSQMISGNNYNNPFNFPNINNGNYNNFSNIQTSAETSNTNIKNLHLHKSNSSPSSTNFQNNRIL